MIVHTLIFSFGEGAPDPIAQAVAGHVDWHQVANLVQHGCPPRLELHIIR